MMTHVEPWTTLRVLNWTKDFLAGKGIENARLESEWLICAATGLDRVGLYLNYDKPLNDEELAGIRSMVTRRGRREPLQHILGSQEFFGIEFEVTPEVLVPRHDTETLVHEALKLLPNANTVLDIGTGSGCIAVALAKRMPMAAITATDISMAALMVARRNADRNGVVIEFLQGSLCEPLAGRCFDLIVSNPPYIPSRDIETLEPEVRDYDPRGALDGGADGLDLYRALIPSALFCLNPGGWLLVEIGAGQFGHVERLFRMSGEFGEPITACDPGGIVRVVGGQKKNGEQRCHDNL
jgi:release factor glutamine methyltransferase